jgi:hypothetical protein
VGGVSFATIREQRDTVARLMVQDLSTGRLEASPGRLYHIDQDGKQRRLFDFPLVELIIQDAVAHWLAEKAAHALSPHVYSYRAGSSYHRALRDLARYIRVSMASRRERGLYVLRRDVHAYFDSIPVHDGAPMWRCLEQVIGSHAADAPAWLLLRRALRPPLRDADGVVYRLECGIPTGSPVANVVANLYLGAMDSELSRVRGAFYARYGDDVVACHPDADVSALLGTTMATHLAAKGLESSVTKAHDHYLTARGGPRGADGDPEPTAAFEFLGHRISAHGTVSLSLKKTRSLLADVRRRASNGARNQRGGPERRISGATSAVNRLLDPESTAAHPYAHLLRTTVTDRDYLKWLDHELALTVLAAALGGKHVRHFRLYSPRTLREQFRLRSVVAARNLVGRSR